MAVRIEAFSEPIPGYKLLDRLGAGGFGEVWRAEAPGGIFKAVKIIHGDLRSRDTDLVRYAEQELKALKRVKQVRHPYLLALDRYDIVEGRLLIVMELADCNLWDRFRECRDHGLPGIPRDELLLYMAEIAEVLDLFNDEFQLQHLDIKPQNLFLLYNHVKVADFGQVKDLQGLTAEVTGGITPVYAAPETFDGVITRFCDQYSLACVYQELLSGVRPFDGNSMSQLLMQHLSLPPNLEPAPSADRLALVRALAKRPEDRWPNVNAFVQALRGGGAKSGRVARLSGRVLHEQATRLSSAEAEPTNPSGPALRLIAPGDTPPPRGVTEAPDPFIPAPPESTGPGPLRPALVVGLGEVGLRVLQRLRFELTERFGPVEKLPAVRTLYIDTDPDSLDEAGRARVPERIAALPPADVFAAKLNRAAHYLKPRFNGRSLTEGWFDTQLLYKIPRTPQTMGLRLFGRLAFCDHVRPLLGKVQADLEAILAEEALALTEARTGLKRRTNRPCVYVVAGLAGGTGGGMFLDVAYALRVRLKRMGYEDPVLIGLLVVPPADPTVTPTQALANTYAALTELNHYARPDTTFAAHYDDRNGGVREKDPPFSRCYLVPGSAAVWGLPGGTGTRRTPRPRATTPIQMPDPRPLPGTSGSAGITSPEPRPVPTADPLAGVDEAVLKPCADAAELIRLSLFTPLGRRADEERPVEAPGTAPVSVATVGLAAFGWPRPQVIARTAAVVAQRVLKRWSAPDFRRAREVIPAIAQERWSLLGFDQDTILARLRRAADRAAGGTVEGEIGVATDPLAPRGWRARLPEPEKVTLALDRLVKLLGPPASPSKRPPTPVEQALNEAATDIGQALAADVRALVPVLVDDAEFRLSGAEELLRQFLTATDRLRDYYGQSVPELDAKAQAGFECLSHYAHFQKGMRKPTAPEFVGAVRQYPGSRFQSLTFRALVGIYQVVRETLAAELADVTSARQRLEATTIPEPPAAATEPSPAGRLLMPPGCASLADAAVRFLAVLTDADLAEIDRRVQRVIDPEPGGILRVCLNATAGPGVIAAAVYEEARAYLDARLGEVDLAAMFAARYGAPRQTERVIEQTYQEAEPTLVTSGPWASGEVAVVGCPAGPGGEPLREMARRAIPVPGLPVADLRDDLVFYREWPVVPLAALPQLGVAAAEAYHSLQDGQQCTAHARLDVTVWKEVDAP